MVDEPEESGPSGDVEVSRHSRRGVFEVIAGPALTKNLMTPNHGPATSTRITTMKTLTWTREDNDASETDHDPVPDWDRPEYNDCVRDLGPQCRRAPIPFTAADMAVFD